MYRSGRQRRGDYLRWRRIRNASESRRKGGVGIEVRVEQGKSVGTGESAKSRGAENSASRGVRVREEEELVRARCFRAPRLRASRQSNGNGGVAAPAMEHPATQCAARSRAHPVLVAVVVKSTSRPVFARPNVTSSSSSSTSIKKEKRRARAAGDASKRRPRMCLLRRPARLSSPLCAVPTNRYSQCALCAGVPVHGESTLLLLARQVPTPCSPGSADRPSCSPTREP